MTTSCTMSGPHAAHELAGGRCSGVLPERAGREGDTQPLPIGNDLPIAHELVAADLADRLALGIKRYGQPLQPFNGRNALRDAYEEALDLCVYLRSALYEIENPQQDPDSGDLEQDRRIVDSWRSIVASKPGPMQRPPLHVDRTVLAELVEIAERGIEARSQP